MSSVMLFNSVVALTMRVFGSPATFPLCVINRRLAASKISTNFVFRGVIGRQAMMLRTSHGIEPVSVRQRTHRGNDAARRYRTRARRAAEPAPRGNRAGSDATVRKLRKAERRRGRAKLRKLPSAASSTTRQD
jgi:hypothetical protein